MAGAFSDAEWRFQQGFAIERSGVLRIAVPLESLDHAQPDLRDLRLQGPDGVEVPYALVRPSNAPARWKPALDFAMALEEGATVLRIDAGENRIWESIDLTVRSAFFLKATRLEASTDGKTWQQWGDGVPIFRKTEAEQTTLSLRREPARYFRVTLNDRRQSPVIVTAARLREPASDQISVEPITIRIARTDEYARETSLTLDLPAANLDLDSLEMVATDRLFTRTVRAGYRQFSDGEIEERTISTDTIFRINLEDTPRAEKTFAAVGATVPGRELVLHLENGDSSPLHLEQIKGLRRVVYLAFNARAVGRYIVWSGNPQASVPEYDVATMSDTLRKLSPTTMAFEAAAPNPNYHHADPLAGLSLVGSAVNLREWSHHRAVQMESGGVQLLELDLAALSTAQRSLSDLRLVRGDRQVPYIIERTRLSRKMDLTATPEPTSKPPTLSRWRVQLPYPAAPFTQLALTTVAPLFQRDIRVFERRPTDNGEIYEIELGHATWQRTPQEAATPLVLSLSSIRGSDLWIQTDNGDNPPIELESVRGYYPVNRLLFLPEATREIVLLSGNPQAPSPRYDLSLVAQTLLGSEKKTATLTPVATVKFIEAPPATLSLKTTSFWAALALVVVALLVVVAKLLPKPPGSK